MLKLYYHWWTIKFLLQISEPTKELLDRDGTFNYTPRTVDPGEELPEKLDGRTTYWLIGRTNTQAEEEREALRAEREAAKAGEDSITSMEEK